ncbi:hypothetical protein [Rahnella sp. PCH160]|uniref:hypothetical protein n=1 Tax=Rahnella sp. PCH160 TaxID=3447928 RepID=UPI0039FC6A07
MKKRISYSCHTKRVVLASLPSLAIANGAHAQTPPLNYGNETVNDSVNLGYSQTNTDACNDGYSQVSSGKYSAGFAGGGVTTGNPLTLKGGQNLNGGSVGVGLNASLSKNWSATAKVNTLVASDVSNEVHAYLGAEYTF